MLPSFSVRQSVEVFHLLLLNQLGGKISRDLFTLKGGCNLRFYFKSIRYSEDMDLDVVTIGRETLKKNVSKILDSQSLQQILQTRDIQIIEWSSPKQTDTVQRWKVQLKVPRSDMPVPTKIEFSRRQAEGEGGRDESAVEPVDADLIRQYNAYPILSRHYLIDTAFNQKVGALIHRSETQARDIFDLDLLIRTKSGGATARPRFKMGQALSINEIERAQENALSLRYSDFLGQVVSFLPPEYQEYYSSENAWNQTVSRVIEQLEELPK